MFVCRRKGDEDGVGERQGEKVKICIAFVLQFGMGKHSIAIP
jgi:hypothetical protein